MTNNVVVHTRVGRIDRVPPGTTPKVELELLPQQYICAFKLERTASSVLAANRKTVDWTWVAHIVERIV